MATHVPRYKIALLGDAGVGKTTLLMRLHTGRFIDTESPTFTLCGRDTIQYEVSVDNTRVEVSAALCFRIIFRSLSIASVSYRSRSA